MTSMYTDIESGYLGHKIPTDRQANQGKASTLISQQSVPKFGRPDQHSHLEIYHVYSIYCTVCRRSDNCMPKVYI